jgi:hypothetical protein
VKRCSSHFEHTHVTATEVARTLADAGRVVQQSSAVAEYLLAFPAEQKSAPDAIEQL